MGCDRICIVSNCKMSVTMIIYMFGGTLKHKITSDTSVWVDFALFAPVIGKWADKQFSKQRLSHCSQHMDACIESKEEITRKYPMEHNVRYGALQVFKFSAHKSSINRKLRLPFPVQTFNI